MEIYTEILGANKTIMLDSRGYGQWKVRMMQLIRGQGEDAWTAVEDGWEAPHNLTDEGVKITKPKDRWTIEEKNLSKFNAKAMNTIFGVVTDDEFKQIQGCKSAKRAWDILQESHEGTSAVKRTKLDHLVSRFEQLRMEPDESIVHFSSQLSAIASEAEVLGKIYKDQKLVKKLIRCLPPQYAAHRAVMRVAGNIDSMKFSELVGMLKSEEMEVNYEKKDSKGVAFKAAQEENKLQEIKDDMALMAMNFGKALQKMERGQGQNFQGQNNQTTSRKEPKWGKNSGDYSGNKNYRGLDEKLGNRKDIQCYECGGFGHVRSDCPVAKRKDLKCIECKGSGHVKSECPNLSKGKFKSFLSRSDSESEDSEEEELLNFVAFVSTSKTENDDALSCSSDSDMDEPTNSMTDYRCD